MTHGAEGRSWYAVRTKSRFEFKVLASLQALCIDAFLPLYSTVSRWSDRSLTKQYPLFPGYVFVRLPSNDTSEVMRVRGVTGFLYSSLNPTPIGDAEIETVRRVCASMLDILPCPYVPGVKVTIESGALAGISGVVVQTKSALRMVVSIELLNRAVSVELDTAAVSKIAQEESKAA